MSAQNSVSVYHGSLFRMSIRLENIKPNNIGFYLCIKSEMCDVKKIVLSEVIAFTYAKILLLVIFVYIFTYIPGPGCSKPTTSLVDVSLKFQTLISEIFQYFFVETM